MSLKAAKESFVSGHGGTTVHEITTVIVALLAGYLVRNVLFICIPQVVEITRPSTLLSFLLDLSTVVLPGVLVFTVLADHALHVCLALTSCAALVALWSVLRTQHPSSCRLEDIPYTYNTFPFITATRTYTNLFTAIAILAVDFSIFPRRFAKAETYGTGLMDIGVGLFMLAHGITAPEARSSKPSPADSHSVRGFLHRLVGTGRRVLPLLVLGMVRVCTVKATDYQEHVTEYGVHWNFFFTIATVRLLCTVLHPLLSLLPCFPYALSATLLAILHQVFLSWGGGTALVVLGPAGDGSRRGLLSANREGLVSSVGYLAIYMGSIELGRWLLRPRKNVREFLPVLFLLCAGDVVIWTLTSLSQSHVDLISRRMANLPFVLWIFSESLLILLLFLAMDLLLLTLSHLLHSPLPSPLYSPPSAKPTHPPAVCIVSAVDYNQLGFFLLANLLTGLVNLSLDTLHTGPAAALAVLLGYMCVLVAVFLVLHRLQIRLKI